MQRGLVPPPLLLSTILSDNASAGGSLPTLKAVLADDDVATRHMATRMLGDALAAVRGALDPDLARGLYHEMLKRLDDSNDAVRLIGCGALAALAHSPTTSAAECASAAECWRGTPVEYVIDTLLLHLDDTAPAVQAAVYGALVPWAALAPEYARKGATAAASRHRSPALCQQLLEHLAHGA